MPKCERCEKEKVIEEFSKRKPNFCSWCLKQIAQKKFDSSEKGREKARRYAQTEKGKLKIKRANAQKIISGYKKKWRSSDEQKKKVIEYNAKYAKENLDIKRVHGKTQRERYPEKHKARSKLKREVKKGNIIKPKICSVCDKEHKTIEGHHEDYTQPLNVIWVCAPCHKEIHK